MYRTCVVCDNQANVIERKLILDLISNYFTVSHILTEEMALISYVSVCWWTPPSEGAYGAEALGGSFPQLMQGVVFLPAQFFFQ